MASPAAPPYPAPYPPLPPARRSVPVLLPHLIWEPVLLLVTAGVVIGAIATTPIFEGDGMLWTMAQYGLAASGVALSLRTATPNLAVGAIAGAAGVSFGWLAAETNLPLLVAALIVAGGAVVFGALLGLLTGLTSAPAWAVSLAGLAAAQAYAFMVAGPREMPVPRAAPEVLESPAVWFAAFMVISIVGGVLFAIPAVRRSLSANRTTTDPVRFGGGKLLGALVGFVGSSLLGGLAGLATTLQLGGAFVNGASNDYLLLGALAAALLGGASGFGGRGGILGTLLAVVLLATAIRWLQFEQVASTEFTIAGQWLVVVAAIVVGVILSRVFELIAPGGVAPAPVTPALPASGPPAYAPPPAAPAPAAYRPPPQPDFALPPSSASEPPPPTASPAAPGTPAAAGAPADDSPTVVARPTDATPADDSPTVVSKPSQDAPPPAGSPPADGDR